MELSGLCVNGFTSHSLLKCLHMVPKDRFDESVRREVLADGDRKPESAEEKGTFSLS